MHVALQSFVATTTHSPCFLEFDLLLCFISFWSLTVSYHQFLQIFDGCWTLFFKSSLSHLISWEKKRQINNMLSVGMFSSDSLLRVPNSQELSDRRKHLFLQAVNSRFRYKPSSLLTEFHNEFSLGIIMIAKVINPLFLTFTLSVSYHTSDFSVRLCDAEQHHTPWFQLYLLLPDRLC